jgi:hypothetical protein
MYLDNMTTLAIIIALVSTMTMTAIAVYKAHQWEQAYHDMHRELKMERANTRKEAGWSLINRYNLEIEEVEDDVRFNPIGKAYIVRIVDSEQELISDGVAGTLEEAFTECMRGVKC